MEEKMQKQTQIVTETRVILHFMFSSCCDDPDAGVAAAALLLRSDGGPPEDTLCETRVYVNINDSLTDSELKEQKVETL